MPEYQERDIMELDKVGNHYGKHVLAMTREDLRSKSDIAAELGYRDMVIDQLTEEHKKLREALEKTLPVVNRAAAMDDSDAKLVIRGVQKLLSELGGE
ncbi:TPA: hypothetical protein PMB21_001509 [Vibrio cholerae]|nr:hypothetical protein [Vibrio cholerae]